MSESIFSVIKRDGKHEELTPSKIYRAVAKAYRAVGQLERESEINALVERVLVYFQRKGLRAIEVEQIQDAVERELMALAPEVAKRYIIYREWRTVEREKRTRLKHTMDGIVTIEKNDVNLGNANMSAYTPAGQMMTFASEVTKDYATKYLLSPQYAKAHRDGLIHIHDLDYYPTKTATCVQYDLADLFERGFRTKNGSIRTPQSIHSYATLATIIFQTNQNEQHGGQSIPAFDFFMAPGVRKTYQKHLLDRIVFILELHGANISQEARQELKTLILTHVPSVQRESQCPALLEAIVATGYTIGEDELAQAMGSTYRRTELDTYQAMEGFIHNLNTMHSRGGNQVVFSSINYGTDTSLEGRMVMRQLLKATKDGLGKGEVPIFPIQIFKVKEGVNFSTIDYERAIKDFDQAMAGGIAWETPNFDLLLEACQATSQALFPNFVFLDTKYNRSEEWRSDDPKRYLHEVATMGCRTRVFDNINGVRNSVGRGNLSFTTLNMPRLAIEAQITAEAELPGADKHALRERAVQIFLEQVRATSALIAEQLYERYLYQRTALAKQFPFMMGNDVWKGGGRLSPDEEVGDVWLSGTLGIGFIGGHNAMVALYGEGHGHNDAAWDTLYTAVDTIRQVAEEYKQKYHLNYSCIATPAEGLSGRFTKMDRKRYGAITGVNDLDYYVNSFHVDVREPIGMFDKIKREAPFHALTTGGHISYIELDGEAKKNVSVILKLVKVMKDHEIGYGSINHPVDTCNSCGYRGIIYHQCPLCKSDRIARLRRITGYLTGSLDSWNSAKQAEEADRVKHH